MPRNLDPLDPRQAIDDVIINDKHGVPHLIRVEHCVISAPSRVLPPTATIQVAAYEMRDDGTPMGTPAKVRDDTYTVDKMPPELAAWLAAWLAGETPKLAHLVIDLEPEPVEEVIE